MWARMVAEELCAHLAESLVDDHEQDVRLNVREPGFRAQLPRSPLGLYTKRARLVGTGVSERGAGWLVVELCARELPALPLGTAQRLLPVRLAIWSCRPAPSAARLDALPTSRLGGNAGHRAGI